MPIEDSSGSLIRYVQPGVPKAIPEQSGKIKNYVNPGTSLRSPVRVSHLWVTELCELTQ